MNPTLNRILQEVCSAAGTGVQQFLDDYCLEAEAAAKERQRTSDIKAAVLSFIDCTSQRKVAFSLIFTVIIRANLRTGISYHRQVAPPQAVAGESAVY